MLQTQVVKSYHGDEDHREGKDLPGYLQVHLDGGKVHAGRPDGGHEVHEPAQADRDHALEEGDKERGVQLLAVQQVVVEEHHGDGDEPVENHHQGDLQSPNHEGFPLPPLLGPRIAQRHPQDPGTLQLGPVHDHKLTNQR